MTEVRVTSGHAGVLVHVVRRGSDESLCGRAYAGPQEHRMNTERWKELKNACRSCRRSLEAAEHQTDTTGGHS